MLLVSTAGAQVFQIKGRVINDRGQGIDHAYIVFQESNEVIFTNDSGFFNCNLQDPALQVLIKKPGYIPQKIFLAYHFDEKMLITLDSANSGTDFDATGIMRIAASQREKNEKRYVAYKSRVYKKNVAYIHNIPFTLWKISGTLLPTRADSGIVFISEKESEFHYQDPDNFDEQVIHYHTGGKVSVPGWHYIPDLDFSLYHPRLFLKNVSSVAYNSPLSLKSLKHYNFTAVASFYEGERKVYRIGIKPKNNYSANFSGFVDLYGDSTYNLSSVDLELNDRNLLRIVDSFALHEVYYHSTSSYHQASQQQSYFLNIFGFRCKYDIFTFFKDHHFYSNDTLYYDKQVVTMDSSSITHDENVWDSIRPLNLPEFQQNILEDFPHSSRWIDQEQQSVDPMFEALDFRLIDLLGDGYDIDNERSTTKIFPIWPGLGYNTVEGAFLRYDIAHTRYFRNSEILFQPEIRYGYPANTLYSKLKVNYFYDLDHPRLIGIEGGHAISQFNEDQPILPPVSALYTLFLSRNYMKMYARDFLTLNYEWEITNGLEMSTAIDYAYRYPLYNRTDFRIIGNPTLFTPNNPDFPPVISNEGFDPHHALTLDFSLAYQFDQQYKMINGRKINIPTKSPRIYIDYHKGIPSAFSQTDYDHINAGFYFQTKFNKIGLSKFDINGGAFLQNRNVPFIDYRHFKGVQIFFLQPPPRLDNTIREFSTLPYYDYSTNKAYVEGHFEHSFEGLLLGRSNLLGPLKLHSFLGFNYLNTFSKAQFLEFFVGIDNILNVIRLEFAGGFDNFLQFKPLVRVGIDFDYRYYLDHRKKIPRD